MNSKEEGTKGILLHRRLRIFLFLMMLSPLPIFHYKLKTLVHVTYKNQIDNPGTPLNTPENPQLSGFNKLWFQTQLNKTYSLLGYNFSGPPNVWTCRHMRHSYFFPKIKVMFTGVPKSGCSNWKEYLLQAEGALNSTLNRTVLNDVHSIYSNPYRLSRQSVHKQANKASAGGGIFSFAVVRNPWTRLVSGFRDKLSDEVSDNTFFGPMADRIIREMNQGQDVSNRKYPTFSEYISWIADNMKRSNHHFTPQHHTLCFPHVNYDLIIPLELSNVFMEKVANKINSSEQLQYSYDHTSDPRRQGSALRAREWLSQADPVTIDKLYKIFEADFALMNYSNFSDPDFPLPILTGD